ncbi:MAG: hypothetical protein KJZ93_09165 [Caldilineaceae bacterium]|nr:hypothetical protein [Caldilineaceae bacterium]
MFGMKTVVCPAGQWTTLIRSRFAQLPKVWRVHLRSEDGEVAGEFAETKSIWIFPGHPVHGKLCDRLTFVRGYWNTFYTVRIRPRATVMAEMR